MAYSSEFLVFKGDSPVLQQELLAHLAAIPILANTGAFTPKNLQFALSRHAKVNGTKTKGNFFTAGFTLINVKSYMNIPDLIIEAQSQQEKECFNIPLTAITASGPKVTKAKVSFALNLENLADTFRLEFQVRIPLVVTESPSKDFALLVSEVLFPDAVSHNRTSLQQGQLINEIERIQSFCLPLKDSITEHGIIVNKLMTGFFPLNLEDDEHRDVAICQRLIFAALFGLDLRPRHRERYLLFLPILSDKKQLERTPSTFRNLVASMQKAFEESGLAPSKFWALKPKSSNALSSTSDSESEELFQARIQGRAAALKLLSTVSLASCAQTLEFPPLTHTIAAPLTTFSQSRPPTLCTFFLQGKCTKGLECSFVHETQSSRASNVNMNASLQQRPKAESIKAQGAPSLPSHPFDGSVIFTDDMRKAFPTVKQIEKASVKTDKPDGDCLWSSFLDATKGMQIGLPPDTSNLQLRLMTLHFLKANVDKPCLPVIAIPSVPLSLTSPREVLAAQMPKRLLKIDGKRIPCSCMMDKSFEKTGHICGGQKYGDIVIFGEADLHLYTTFDEYFDGMCRKGAFSEELEIMTLSALFKVNIAVFTPDRVGQEPAVTCFFQPAAKGLALLINQNGQGHYDWLSFAESTAPKDAQEASITPAAVSAEPKRLPLTQWLEIKIVELHKAFEVAKLSIKFPVAWPLNNNGKHIPLLQPLDSQLGSIPIQPSSTAAPEAAIDPWTEPFSSHTANMIADGILKIVSGPIFMEAEPNSLSILSAYLLSRIFTLVYSILNRHGNIVNLYSTEYLLDFREAMKKLIDTIALLRPLSKIIPVNVFKDAFLLQSTTVSDKLESLNEIFELCFTIAQRSSFSQSSSEPSKANDDAIDSADSTGNTLSDSRQSLSAPPPQSPTSRLTSQTLSQEDYASQFLTVCDDLSRKAEKSALLAKDP